MLNDDVDERKSDVWYKRIKKEVLHNRTIVNNLTSPFNPKD